MKDEEIIIHIRRPYIPVKYREIEVINVFRRRPYIIRCEFCDCKVEGWTKQETLLRARRQEFKQRIDRDNYSEKVICKDCWTKEEEKKKEVKNEL